MKNKITANIGLKIISLLFAVVLWMVVNNIENPTVSELYSNIPVKLINTDLITDAGKVYEVLDETDVVERVTVRAPKSVHSSLNAGNIIAVADVSELSSLDTITIRFSSNIYADDIESIKGNIDTVKLNIENKRTKTLSLKATVSGEVGGGYLVGDVQTAQNLVRISGPESVIEKINRAAVDVDVTGFTNDIETNLEIRLYDEEGHLIQDNRVSQNIKSVGVSVDIYQTKEVPIYFAVSGEPEMGYRVSGEVKGSVETVTLAGKSSILKNIEEIEVPEEAIDVTGVTEDYVEEINIREYLPDNVFLADSAQAKIEVTVNIEREVSKELDIQSEKINVVNVPEGFRATIEELEETIAIEVIGLPGDISELRDNTIDGRVDIAQWMEEEGLEEAEEGYFEIEVDFGLGDEITILEPMKVLVHLSRPTE